ncbi:MAG: hypothetical protein KGI09_03315 [Thaumarchaeota archaeon]|nr:hypothetical protein [Nitrososphaerota archaeon]MDE1877462.1 hypothetical protein [Nitrososphaerota archaeon]
MLKIILAVAVTAVISFFIIPVYATGFDNSFERLVLEKQKEYPSWYVGKGILPQQSYTYHICDYSIKPILNYATPCYEVELDFIGLLQEQTGQTWIVQAIFTPDDAGKHWFSILHISSDFATITTDGISMNYATSLSHTIFYLQKYANMHKPQLLKIGTSWGLVDEYVSPIPQLIVNRFTTINTGNAIASVYQVGFEVIKDNTFYLKDDIPFPVESTLYDSKTANTDVPALYQVKLLRFSNVTKDAVDQSLDVKQVCQGQLLLEPVGHKTLAQTNNNSESKKHVIWIPKQLKASTLSNDVNNTYSNQTSPSNTGNNFTQNMIQGNTENQNYTNEINSTTEGQILNALRRLGVNFTNSSG